MSKTRRQSIAPQSAVVVEEDEPKTSARQAKERRADRIGERALRMFEAVLTYVEANGIDYEGIWLDPGSESDCEEFTRQYLDEKHDVDPPSFNAKHPSMRIAQFPNIIRNYLIKYANPMMPVAAIPHINIIAMPPSSLTSPSGHIIDLTAFLPQEEKKKPKFPGHLEDDEDDEKELAKKKAAADKKKEDAEQITTTMLKFEHARKIVAFLNPWEQAVMARLLVHVIALHGRACFNGMAWTQIGRAFSFVMRAVSSHLETRENLTSKCFEFFASNIDSVFSAATLLPFGEACRSVSAEHISDDTDYGETRLSLLGKETFIRAKYRLYPGSSAASIMTKIRHKQRQKQRRISMRGENEANMLKLTWVDNLI